MKLIGEEASTPNFFLLFFALPCLLHLFTSIATRSLAFAEKLCDTLSSKMNAPMKYWSQIAKTMHCSRDRYKLEDTEWALAFGVVEADTCAKRMPPQRSADAGGHRGQRGATEWTSIGRSPATTGQRASERASDPPTLSCQAFFNFQCATHLGVVSFAT